MDFNILEISASSRADVNAQSNE